MGGGKNTSHNSTTTRAAKKKSRDSDMDKNNKNSLLAPAISSTPESPSVVSTNNPRELKNLVILLQNKVEWSMLDN